MSRAESLHLGPQAGELLSRVAGALLPSLSKGGSGSGSPALATLHRLWEQQCQEVLSPSPCCQGTGNGCLTHSGLGREHTEEGIV